MSENENEKVETPQQTILIIGISSFVGSNLAEYLKRYYRIVGTYYKNPVKINGVLTLPMNILKKEEVQRVIFSFRPDFTIYCAGINSIVECSKSSKVTDAMNTNGLITVAEYCQRYKSQVCYLSSAHVFSGEEKKYIEMDIPDANTVYGKSQAAAEFYIQKTSLNYVIFRTCRLYGRSLKMSNPNYFETLQKELHAGRQVTCDNNIFSGYLDVCYVAAMIKICFDKEVKNRLFQVGSRDIMSAYDFACLYSEIFNHGQGMVAKGKWPFPLLKGMGSNAVSDKFHLEMDTSNIEGFLGVKLPTVEESLAFSFRRFDGVHDKDKKSDNQGTGIKFI